MHKHVCPTHTHTHTHTHAGHRYSSLALEVVPLFIGNSLWGVSYCVSFPLMGSVTLLRPHPPFTPSHTCTGQSSFPRWWTPIRSRMCKNCSTLKGPCWGRSWGGGGGERGKNGWGGIRHSCTWDPIIPEWIASGKHRCEQNQVIGANAVEQNQVIGANVVEQNQAVGAFAKLLRLLV